MKCFRCGSFGHRANRCATPLKGKSKAEGRDDTKGKGKGLKGGGNGQGGGHPCGHCGKTGRGPANCWTLQIPWKRIAAVEEEAPVGGLGFDIGFVEVPAPPRLGRTPVKIRNRFQVMEERLEVSIGGLESEVYVETVRQDREKLKLAGRGRITIDSGVAESVLLVGMLPGDRKTVGKMENREKRVRFRRNGSEAVNSITFQ